jgi:hypothetical protein
MDAADAITRVFAALEGRAVEAVVPTKAARPPRGVVPVRRFKLDGRQEPDRTLPAQTHPAPARQARPQGIPSPPRLGDRLPPLSAARGLHRRQGAAPGHPAAQGPSRPAARPTQAREMGGRERSIDARHRIRAEGFHGEAKTWHGLARAVRRG